MKHLLLAKALWNIANEAKVLADKATAAAQAEFVKLLQRALSTIVLAFGTSQLYLVTSSEHPKEAWDAHS